MNHSTKGDNTDKLYDVIIAGGGPVGLFLACELALAGTTSVLVLERELKSDLASPWKTMPLGLRGMNTLSIEHLYRRDLLEQAIVPGKRVEAFQKTPGFQFGGHFAGITFDANKLDLDRYKYRISGPALVPGGTSLDRMESAFAERAESLGVTILHGHGVVGITEQTDCSVTVETKEQADARGEGRLFRGRWLVGCDGGRSVVRKAAGIEFVGTEANLTGYALRCDLDHPEKLRQGFDPTKTGMYILGPGKPSTLHLVDFDGGAFDRTQQVTKEHAQAVLTRVSATDVKMTNIHLVTTFTDRSKQAVSYRKGRILLAGDAAHIHGPLGSQGLNAGLGDAMNLGWKLAATIRRESQMSFEKLEASSAAPASHLYALLDTYERERHPIGAWVLQWTRGQIAALRPDPFGASIQSILRDVIDTVDGANLFIDRFWGLSQRYDLGESAVSASHSNANTKHPLVGSSVPEFEMDDGVRFGRKLLTGKALLIDFKNNATLKELVAEHNNRARTEAEIEVNYISQGARDARGLTSLLVRPDGIVAWVAEDGDQEPDVKALKIALGRWFSFGTEEGPAES